MCMATRVHPVVGWLVFLVVAIRASRMHPMVRVVSVRCFVWNVTVAARRRGKTRKCLGHKSTRCLSADRDPPDRCSADLRPRAMWGLLLLPRVSSGCHCTHYLVASNECVGYLLQLQCQVSVNIYIHGCIMFNLSSDVFSLLKQVRSKSHCIDAACAFSGCIDFPQVSLHSKPLWPLRRTMSFVDVHLHYTSSMLKF